MTRLSMSDVIQAQEARIDSLTLMVERLTAMHAEALAALTESRRPTASESVELARSGVGGNPTTAKVSVVVQDGETLTEATDRAMIEYERMANRYPLPNGQTHAAPLQEPGPTLREQLEASVHGLRSVPDADGEGK